MDETEKKDYASWKPAMEMERNNGIDCWFLRDNGLNAKIALRILAIAYKGEEREEESMETVRT